MHLAGSRVERKSPQLENGNRVAGIISKWNGLTQSDSESGNSGHLTTSQNTRSGNSGRHSSVRGTRLHPSS